jgi:peptidoglycan/xylan/chitin deacetylase (PgdA/CDA1 family)
LTFDDGPTPEVTLWVLNELKKHNFKATFFCIGKNIEENIEVFKQISLDGHRIGNHTQHHENGWKTETVQYLKSFNDCQKVIEKHIGKQQEILFRPPYGKISRWQIKAIGKNQSKIVMWSNLSQDYKKCISNEKCYLNSIYALQKGDIIVFHDSKKAFENLKEVLPRTLAYLKKEGFVSKTIN